MGHPVSTRVRDPISCPRFESVSNRSRMTFSRVLRCAPIPSGLIIPRMNKTTPIVLFVLFLLPIIGCDDIAKQAGYVPAKTSAKPTPAPAPRHPIHRFVLTQFGGGVALDTQTGQICKTWDWEPLGKEPAPDPVSGNVAPRAFGEFSPTCISLYNSYPTTGTESQELGGENSGQNRN
jgi:hypothetical protein